MGDFCGWSHSPIESGPGWVEVEIKTVIVIVIVTRDKSDSSRVEGSPGSLQTETGRGRKQDLSLAVF